MARVLSLERERRLRRLRRLDELARRAVAARDCRRIARPAEFLAAEDEHDGIEARDPGEPGPSVHGPESDREAEGACEAEGTEQASPGSPSGSRSG